jgi:hypothetical protein
LNIYLCYSSSILIIKNLRSEAHLHSGNNVGISKLFIKGSKRKNYMVSEAKNAHLVAQRTG